MMKTRQVVVEITDEMYDWFTNGFPDEADLNELQRIIINGTLLPEDHGDLIDVNAIRIIESFDGCRYALEREIRRLPVIIKAEGGDAE